MTIRSPTSAAAAENVPMLLDTGADVSLLPRAAIATLVENERLLPNYELEGFDGTKSFSPVVELEMFFVGKSFRGQFLVIDATQGILGRNVLNSVPLVFDGPALTWQELRSLPTSSAVKTT